VSVVALFVRVSMFSNQVSQQNKRNLNHRQAPTRQGRKKLDEKETH